jgi:putative membrane protein
MPSEGHRLHGFTVVTRGLRLGRQLLLPAVLGGASVGDGLGAVVQWTVVILAIPSFALAVAQWVAFRYRLDDDELVIDSGVLSRRRRIIPLARIQNVDLSQSALERVARVAELKLETASGGSETEAALSVLALRKARTLRDELLARRARALEGAGRADVDLAGPDRDDGTDLAAVSGRGRLPGGQASAQPAGETAAPAAAEELLRLGLGDLAIAGATSNEAGLIAAGLATALEVLDDLGALARVNAWLQSAVEQGAGLGATGAVVVGGGLVLGFLVLGWLVSIVATVVRFYGFTLTREGEDLRREYGLLSRHHSTVPLKRVQAVRIEETLLRRPFGLAALKIETAGASPRQRENARGGGAEAYVPITRRRDVARLVRAVFDDARFEGVEMHPVAPVSRRRSFLRLAAPVVLATAVAAFLVPWGVALAGLLLPAWIVAGAQYRARAWARPEGYAIVRAGVLTRTNAVIPVRKIQTLHARETPFQRRWGLATVMIDTAGGGRAARAVDLHHGTAQELMLELADTAVASTT